MKKSLIILFFAFALGLTAFAQEQDKKVNAEVLREKIFTKKKAIYLERLQLTKEEAKKFFTIYEQYDLEMFRIKERQHKIFHKIRNKNLGEIDNEVAEEFIKVEIETNEAINNLNKKYFELFQATLPPQKVAKLIMEENKIMREIARDIKQKEKQDKQ
jgi:hypothetical protein